MTRQAWDRLAAKEKKREFLIKVHAIPPAMTLGPFFPNWNSWHPEAPFPEASPHSSLGMPVALGSGL